LPETHAVIDSGVDTSLAAERADFTGRKVTSDMHGTMIAGVIREVAPLARILGYKACVPLSPQSVQASCSASALAKAMDRAIQQKARVINMSLAGPKDKLVVMLVDAAVSGGAAVLAAVGNNGPQGPPGYPAALDNVIAVTAVDANEQLFRYATQGPFTDLAAPGVDILGTIPGNHQILLSGTSLATAYASGAAALLLQRQTNLEPSRLQALLERSAKELGPPGKDPQYGSGLLDACRAVSDLGGVPPCR
jgi:subtilisin family serine protease